MPSKVDYCWSNPDTPYCKNKSFIDFCFLVFICILALCLLKLLVRFFYILMNILCTTLFNFYEHLRMSFLEFDSCGQWYKKPKKFPKSIREVSGTSFIVEKFTILSRVRQCVNSPEFPNNDGMHFNWRLDFYPRGHNLEYPENWTASLILIWKKPRMPVSAVVQLQISDKKKSFMVSSKEDFIYEESGSAGCICICEKSSVWDEKLSSVRDFLSVRVQVTAVCTYLHATNNFASEKKLLCLFSKLLESGAFSDVIIYSNGREFEAHRAILASASAVFDAMLSNEMSRNFTSEITINDFSEITVEKMLQFIYGCKVDLENSEITLDLIKASIRYGLKDLKDQCEDYLSSMVNKTNVVTLLSTAELYNLEDLKETALKYMCKHNEEFSNGREYQVLLTENPELLVELIKRFSRHASRKK